MTTIAATMRAEFEQALRTRDYHYFDGKLVGRVGDQVWEYTSAGTEHAWQGWQAAAAALPLPGAREIALEHAARATVDTLDLYHSISEGGERYEQLRDALAVPTAQASPEAAQLVLQAIKAVNALMNGRTPEEALAAGRSAHLAIQSLALLAKPAIADDAARWRWWRERFVALCGMHCARAAGLDLSTVYVDSPEKMDIVTDAARLARAGEPVR